MTTGWHYFSDLVGGVVVAGIGIAITHKLAKRFYDENEEPHLVLGAG